MAIFDGLYGVKLGGGEGGERTGSVFERIYQLDSTIRKVVNVLRRQSGPSPSLKTRRKKQTQRSRRFPVTIRRRSSLRRIRNLLRSDGRHDVPIARSNLQRALSRIAA